VESHVLFAPLRKQQTLTLSQCSGFIMACFIFEISLGQPLFCDESTQSKGRGTPTQAAFTLRYYVTSMQHVSS
jgi:hypothetical protein